MNFTYSPYVLPLLPAFIASIFVTLYAWFRRTARGAAGLFILSLAVSWWITGYALEIMGADISTKYLWGVLQYFGIAFAPYGWLIFSIEYYRQNKILSRRYVFLTALIPSITVLLALTTQWHGLIWSEYHINQQNNFSALGVSYGIWFWVHFAYSYIALLIGAVLLLGTLIRRQGMYRGQVIAMLVAMLAPWIGNALYLTGNSPIPYLDLTPFAFTVSVAALAWAIFGFHLVDITPLARDQIVESMRDGMIVVDTRGIIADINSAAAHMVGVHAAQTIGHSAAEILSPWPHIIELFENTLDTTDEISVGESISQRRYEVRLTSLLDAQNQFIGRVVMLHSLNEQDTAEKKLGSLDKKPLSSPRVDSQARRSVLGWLFNFFTTPAQVDINIPKDINPSWYQARERSFTIILRVSALLGTLAYFMTLPLIRVSALSAINITYGIIVSLLWFLGLARKIKFGYRASMFLFLVYILGFSETLNFGYSVESFIFFMVLIIASILLTGRKGGWIAATASILTLAMFGFIISERGFIPFNLINLPIAPRNFENGMTSLAVFSACALAISTSITILIESLNSAWQMETQASTLLQQERDLLEQRVNERTRELQENQARFQQIVENASDIIYRTDTNGSFTYANPSALSMMGFTNESDVIGKSYLDLTTPDTRHRLKRTYDYQYLSKTKNTYFEFPAVTADGEIIWVGQNVQLIMEEDKILGFQAVARNITQLKQAQEALLITRDQALDASRFKSQLLSRVSHELRTPLGGILGYAELLQAQAFGTLTEKQENAINQIMDSTHFLTKTVNDLLDQAQIEAKSINLDNSLFAPLGLLNKVKTSMSVLAINKKIDFNTEISTELPNELYGDTHRLQQVLVNLIGNAIKFTKEGEVRVRIIRPAPARWAIEVSDTGDGIPTNELETIFDPFHQVNNTITRENRGSGLGLTITKQLIELMDGKITVQSELGKGSTFTVVLPIIKISGE